MQNAGQARYEDKKGGSLKVNNKDEFQLYSFEEAGRLLSVSRATVFRYVRLGYLPAVRISPGRRRISLAALKAFIEKGKEVK